MCNQQPNQKPLLGHQHISSEETNQPNKQTNKQWEKLKQIGKKREGITIAALMWNIDAPS
jgi:hypothetical protein